MKEVLENHLFCRILLFVGAVFTFEFETVSSEVQEQADFDARRCEVVYELDFVNRGDRLYGFVFDNDTTFDEHIGFKMSNENRIVQDRYFPSEFHLQARFYQFVG